ncbi:MAG TPA: hypothetical protein VMW56_14490 [Candidatus Margulisiibacteriota bacterium]|nr:hypothetical protein [Candidatus Margulisiibacteriota bacterium]
MTKGHHKGHHMGHMAKDGHPFKEHRARGGRTEPEIGGIPEIGGHPEKAEDKPKLSGRKRGGGVEKKRKDHEKLKHGGKVHGKHPGHRLDRRARGGPVGKGKSPFSGADGPNLEYARGPGPESKSRAVGRDKT